MFINPRMQRRKMHMNHNVVCNHCDACGKESDSLKSCVACKLVKYCNRTCQSEHWKSHKKECKQRAAEIYDESLFKEPPPEVCPMCLLPIEEGTSSFNSCCGKSICFGCVYAMGASDGQMKTNCPLCNLPPATSDEELVKRTTILAEAGNAEACNSLAGMHYRGIRGVSHDLNKANELLLRGAKLGCATSYYNLGNAYGMGGRGVAVNEKKAKQYFELAAMNGSAAARHNLAGLEGRAGNHFRGMKHLKIAARSGHEDAMNQYKGFYGEGLVTKDEYESTLLAYQKRQDERKSETREKAKELMLRG